MGTTILNIKNFSLKINKKILLKDISLELFDSNITTLIGPSGSGKSYILKSINKLIEYEDRAESEGSIFFDGKDINEINKYELRRQIAFVFSKPIIFPKMSIVENLTSGLRLNSIQLETAQEISLIQNKLLEVGLWQEYKNDLHENALELSISDRQRLCIARALMLEPKIILFEDPIKYFDKFDIASFEVLLSSLKEKYSILYVTDDIAQAARISDYTAFLYHGELIEFDITEKIFTSPSHSITERFLIGNH